VVSLDHASRPAWPNTWLSGRQSAGVRQSTVTNACRLRLLLTWIGRATCSSPLPLSRSQRGVLSRPSWTIRATVPWLSRQASSRPHAAGLPTTMTPHDSAAVVDGRVEVSADRRNVVPVMPAHEATGIPERNRLEFRKHPWVAWIACPEARTELSPQPQTASRHSLQGVGEVNRYVAAVHDYPPQNQSQHCTHPPSFSFSSSLRYQLALA